MNESPKKPTQSLKDRDIVTRRAIGRRGVLRSVGAGAAALTVGFAAGRAAAVTDSDAGPITDPSGHGRGFCRAFGSAVTDADSGQMADPAGNGRGSQEQRRIGVTDADSDSTVDPAGNGRGPSRGFASGTTDTDGGDICADAAGDGRG